LIWHCLLAIVIKGKKKKNQDVMDSTKLAHKLRIECEGST